MRWRSLKPRKDRVLSESNVSVGQPVLIRRGKIYSMSSLLKKRSQRNFIPKKGTAYHHPQNNQIRSPAYFADQKVKREGGREAKTGTWVSMR